MSRVLVTDGEQRSALAIVRSLGSVGHDVFVVSRRPSSLAGGSRFAARESVAPDPLRSPGGYEEAVADRVDRWSADVLVPVTEASLHALLPARSRFRGAIMPFPEHSVFRAVCDKSAVMREARELGIAVPRQRVIEGPGAVELDGDLDYPVVVKPSRSVVSSSSGSRKTSVVHAADRREVQSVVDSLPSVAFPALVQERVVGPGIGVFLLLWDGELLAAFGHRRLREKPPSGGVSVLRESVSLESDLLQASRQLLDRFGWQGVAMVEYKRDRRTGVPYLMEVNGRFWGSLQLAVDAGVDFPRLLIEAATGGDPEPVTDYSTGVRTRWLLGDVDHLLLRLRRSADELSLSEDAPGRTEAVLDFLSAFGPGSRSEVWRWSDPVPGLREMAAWLRGQE